MTSSNFVLKAGFSSDTSKTDYANNILLIFEDGQRLTYNDVNLQTGKVAECLKNDYNVKKGDTVLCRTTKNHSVIFYLAVLRVGAIYVPLNPLYTPVETTHFLETVEPQLFVTCNLSSDKNFSKLVGGGNVVDENDFAKQAAKLKGILNVEHVEDEDIAVILFTSGTTGKSKGAATSHGTLCRNAQILSETWKFTSKDVLLHSLPFYHVHGMLVAFHCVIFSKSSAIFLSKFTVPDIIKWLPKSTVFMGVPTFYSRLVDSADFKKEHGSNIRLFVCASAPLTQKLFQSFYEKTGGRTILQRFGMTEANAITTSPYPEKERTYENVGKPFPGVEVKISETGAILVRSKTLFSNYWKEPEKTKKEFTEDGFFNTGDVGEINANGFLIMSGRQKDMIISGGLNVYPCEIEQLIDATGEVLESAVIGAPHSDFGEGVVAVCAHKKPVTSNISDVELAEKIANTIKEKLAPYKRPKKWIFVEELPRNFLGKIQKNVLRETYKNLFFE